MDLGSHAMHAAHAAPGTVGPEQALDYLAYLVDTQELFDAALGMYDYGLVRLVASRTNMDPREYEPLLSELASPEEPMTRFRIDEHLKRYESALSWLLQASDTKVEGGVDAVLGFVEKHGLHGKLFGMLDARGEDSGSLVYTRGRTSWGRALVGKKRYVEGGNVLFQAGAYEEAQTALMRGGDWAGSLSAARASGLSSKEDLTLLAYGLSEELRGKGRAGEAARVLVEYTGDVDTAVEILVEGREWKLAVWTATEGGRDDLIVSVVEGGVESACGEVLEEIGERRVKWAKAARRLARVRAHAAASAAAAANGAGEEGGGDEDEDVFSDMESVLSGWTTESGMSSASGSSSSSGMTAASARSMARRKRKMEKKKKRRDQKRGGKNSEQHLIERLKRGVPSASWVRKIGDLVGACIWFGLDELGGRVQRELDDWLLEVEVVYGYIDLSVYSGAEVSVVGSGRVGGRVVERDVIGFEDVGWKVRRYK